MNKARRAQKAPMSKALPIAIAAVLVVAASFVGWRVLSDPSPVTDTKSSASPTETATASPSTDTSAEASASATSAPTTVSSSPEPEPAPTPETSADAAVVTAALEQCRAKVASADAVMAATSAGVANWAAHVQAQTDANDGRISDAEMRAIFTRTRLAGPADQKAYGEAVTAYQAIESSCGAVEGAPEESATALSQCSVRLSAQQVVINQGGPAMADWGTHLADMARSAAGDSDDAMGVWTAAWKAAPTNINAHTAAVAAFEAPVC